MLITQNNEKIILQICYIFLAKFKKNLIDINYNVKIGNFHNWLNNILKS